MLKSGDEKSRPCHVKRESLNCCLSRQDTTKEELLVSLCLFYTHATHQETSAFFRSVLHQASGQQGLRKSIKHEILQAVGGASRLDVVQCHIIRFPIRGKYHARVSIPGTGVENSPENKSKHNLHDLGNEPSKLKRGPGRAGPADVSGREEGGPRPKAHQAAIRTTRSLSPLQNRGPRRSAAATTSSK